MRRAILSDIHGNLEALTAVLADIKTQEVDSIFCLGDMIGYGPNPRECIDQAMQFDVCLLGNHDQGALFDPVGFNKGAERAIFWTRKMLETGDRVANEKRWDFLGEIPRSVKEEELLFVHGSARNPLNEYVFPEDIYNQKKMGGIFSLVPQYCFQGHTHIPGVFTDDFNFVAPEEVDFRYDLGEQKALVNVGSVGQPRNGDPRSSYVVLDDRTLHFRRVDYDRETTIEKIYDIPDLDNFLGDRLRDGR